MSEDMVLVSIEDGTIHEIDNTYLVKKSLITYESSGDYLETTEAIINTAQEFGLPISNYL